MASMFLRSNKTCRESLSSLSEKSRWWPVMHRVPLLGGCSGCRSTTSSTLAVLMCSANSISPPFKHPKSVCRTLFLFFLNCRSGRAAPQSRPRLSCKKTKAGFLLCTHSWLGSVAAALCLIGDKKSINRRSFIFSLTLSSSYVATPLHTQLAKLNCRGSGKCAALGDKRRKSTFPETVSEKCHLSLVKLRTAEGGGTVRCL